jgi:hypothetical protein
LDDTIQRTHGIQTKVWGLQGLTKLQTQPSVGYLGNKRLSDDRVKKLNALGFAWQVAAPPGEVWTKRYNELVEIKREFGHCSVPHVYKSNPQLGQWVNNQRACFKNKSLSDDRVKKLNELGFVWKTRNVLPPKDAWMVRYNELVEFKREFGHCSVPQVYKSNPQLGQWVKRQRARFKNKSLPKDRVAILNNLGFVWKERFGQRTYRIQT